MTVLPAHSFVSALQFRRYFVPIIIWRSTNVFLQKYAPMVVPLYCEYKKNKVFVVALGTLDFLPWILSILSMNLSISYRFKNLFQKPTI